MKSPKPTSRTLTTRNNLPKRDNLTTRPKSCTTISLHNKQITATNPTNVTNCIKVTPGITTNLTTRTFAEIAAIKIGAESRTNLTDLFSGLYQGKSI